MYVVIFVYLIFCNFVYSDIIFPFFVYYVVHFLVTVVTKKKQNKIMGTKVDSDSEEDEESDESTKKESKKREVKEEHSSRPM